MRAPAGSLLEQTGRLDRAPADHARRRSVGLPWGVSESAFAATDAWQVYQYPVVRRSRPRVEAGPGPGPGSWPRTRAFWPSTWTPRPWSGTSGTSANWAGRGRTGFSSLWISPLDGCRPTTGAGWVKAYMAHHQGMSLVAIANPAVGRVDSADACGVSRPCGRRSYSWRNGCRSTCRWSSRTTRRCSARKNKVVSPGFRDARRRLTTPRTRRRRERTCCRTAGTRSWSPTPAVATAGGGIGRSPGGRSTRPPTVRAEIRLRPGRAQTGVVLVGGYQPTTRRPKDYEVTFSVRQGERFGGSTTRSKTLMEIAGRAGPGRGSPAGGELTNHGSGRGRGCDQLRRSCPGRSRGGRGTPGLREAVRGDGMGCPNCRRFSAGVGPGRRRRHGCG